MLPDPDPVLRMLAAVAEGRVLVTENIADYSLLLSDRLRTDEP